jgi:lipopolysaccharide export LptBFGC system permease protein LptF
VSADLQTFQMGNFDTYDIVLDLKSSFGELKKKKRKYREMTIAELLREKTISRRDKQELNEINIEYHKKFSIPFAAFVFGLIGIPLGIRKIRGGKSYGFTISLSIIMIYYLLLLTSETLAKNNTVMPLIAMWIPNTVLGTLGLLLLRSAARETVPVPVHLFGLVLSRWRVRIARMFRDR